MRGKGEIFNKTLDELFALQGSINHCPDHASSTPYWLIAAVIATRLGITMETEMLAAIQAHNSYDKQKTVAFIESLLASAQKMGSNTKH